MTRPPLKKIFFSTALLLTVRVQFFCPRLRHCSRTTGLSVSFDLPTRIGMESDDRRARGEVSKAGVAVASSQDIAMLFDGIPLDQVSVSMTINAPASILLALLLIVAERRGTA